MLRTTSARWNIAFLASLMTWPHYWWVQRQLLVGGFSADPLAPANESSKTIYAREDFTSRVMGKTEDEVQQAIDRPDSTSKDSDSLYWHFRNRTRDLASKDVDTDVQVVFSQWQGWWPSTTGDCRRAARDCRGHLRSLLCLAIRN